MKAKKLVFMIFVIGNIMLFNSCSKDEGLPSSDSINTDIYVTSDEANIIAVKYLKINDGKYILNLTEEEAIKNNISPNDYNRLCNEVNTVNSSLLEYAKRKVNVDLTDPQKVISNNLGNKHVTTRLKTAAGETENPSGHITTSGQEEGSQTIFVKLGYKSIQFTCYATGFLQVFNVSTSANGDKQLKTGVGVIGIWESSIGVGASNTYCTFTFRTANSNGGSCTFTY